MKKEGNKMPKSNRERKGAVIGMYRISTDPAYVRWIAWMSTYTQVRMNQGKTFVYVLIDVLGVGDLVGVGVQN